CRPPTAVPFCLPIHLPTAEYFLDSSLELKSSVTTPTSFVVRLMFGSGFINQLAIPGALKIFSSSGTGAGTRVAQSRLTPLASSCFLQLFHVRRPRQFSSA